MKCFKKQVVLVSVFTTITLIFSSCGERELIKTKEEIQINSKKVNISKKTIIEVNDTLVKDKEALTQNQDTPWSPTINTEAEIVKPEDIIERGNLTKEQACQFVNELPVDNRSIKFYNNGTGAILYPTNGKKEFKEESFEWKIKEKNKITITKPKSKYVGAWKYSLSDDNKVLTITIPKEINTKDFGEVTNTKIKFNSILTFKK